MNIDMDTGIIELPLIRIYETSFYNNYIVNQIDFAFLNNSYQVFNGGASYYNPGINLLTRFGIVDLFEDYRLTAGFRFAGDFDSNEYLLSFENMKGKFDFVLSNPPYRKVGSGRVNPLEEKALARHEILATLEDVLRTGHHLLKNKGRLCLIYPATRTADVFQLLRHFHLEPKKVQFVYSRPEDESSLVLVEALKEGRTQVKVLRPFILYEPGGQYTPQAEDLFR